MASKTILVSDLTGEQINGNAARVTIVTDAEPGTSYTLDTSVEEVAPLMEKATKQRRRGRPRKTTKAPAAA